VAGSPPDHLITTKEDTPMNNTLYRVGETVHILPSDSPKYGGTYKVTKVNPTTYRLAGDVHSNLKAAHSYVHGGPLSQDEVSGPAPEPEVERTALLNLMPGTPVRFIRGHTTDKTKLYVITGTAPRGYRIFPLGGAHRYHTNVPGSMLEVVTEITDWRAEA